MSLSVADSEWFHESQVHRVFAALAREGHEARIVGGAVRNTLLGLPVGDIDFATTAEPKTIIRLAKAAGLKPVPTGVEHGTVTVVVEGHPFEVTTLRHDVETDGRRAKVSFTQDWAADAARRDFTINALYAEASGQVFDPLGGLADLQARRVRFIGSAVQRIREDFLRIMRFFRFTADYSDGPPDAEGLAACIEQRAGLTKLSAERVRAELFRILATRKPVIALAPMADIGLLSAILGGVARLAHFERLEALEQSLGLAPVAIRRLAALAVMVEEDADRLSKRLKLSNAESARLGAMAALDPQIGASTSELAAKEALYRLRPEAFQDRVLIAWARSGDEAGDVAWRALLSLPDRWTPPTFPVSGDDLIARGEKPGPDLGKALRALEAAWIASDFTLPREELLKN
jgi:poly(A) polymerase